MTDPVQHAETAEDGPAAELDAELESDPGSYTPWFKLEWRALRNEYANRLARYAGP